MGYILCKPFFNEMNVEETTSIEDDPEVKYQLLLQEIKRIEAECEAGDIPEKECMAQISEKKKSAANLLYLIKTKPIEQQESLTQEGIPAKPAGNISPQRDDYCPQCGEEVETNDKFCMHCGHTL